MVVSLEGDAFARLYPREYYAKFVSQGMRPDGRVLTQERPISIVRDVVAGADCSALVKLGRATALAGIKLEVASPDDERPGEGSIIVQVELPPMCSASSRPGLVSPRAARLTEELGGLAESGALCDLAQLTHPGGRSVWVAYCDVYVLDADGSLSDVCLLATLAALQALRLPALEPEGAGGAAAPAPHDTPEGPAAPRALRLEPPLTPLTCGVFGGALVVDPTAEEEALMDALVCLRVNGDGQLAGVSKLGGSGLGREHLATAHMAAMRRHSALQGP